MSCIYGDSRYPHSFTHRANPGTTWRPRYQQHSRLDTHQARPRAPPVDSEANITCTTVKLPCHLFTSTSLGPKEKSPFTGRKKFGVPGGSGPHLTKSWLRPCHSIQLIISSTQPSLIPETLFRTGSVLRSPGDGIKLTHRHRHIHDNICDAAPHRHLLLRRIRGASLQSAQLVNRPEGCSVQESSANRPLQGAHKHKDYQEGKS